MVSTTGTQGVGDLESFTDADGVEVAFRRWVPVGPARAIVVVSHGASEHGGRYARFAQRLLDGEYAVYAIDHRGHGATAASTGPGDAGPRGWEGIIDDLRQLVALAREAHPDIPVVLLGHSAGSFVAQLLAQRHGDELDGLILSGSAGSLDDHEGTITFLQALVDEGAGGEPAPLFAAFNEPFEPARTPFDWLSRDEAEVDRYLADPWCGDQMPLTMAFVLDMVRHLAEAWDPANERRLPRSLPVLMVTGEEDPVSDGARTVRELEARYRELGLEDVTARYYPGARHELVNETNRDEVQDQIVEWLDRVTER